jgi:hypothetical protein
MIQNVSFQLKLFDILKILKIPNTLTVKKDFIELVSLSKLKSVHVKI